MNILVINTGSSSIKYQLFDMEKQAVLAHGVVERIGEPKGSLTHDVASGLKKVWDGVITDHHEGFHRMVDLLLDREHGIIRDKSEISAVGQTIRRPVGLTSVRLVS